MPSHTAAGEDAAAQGPRDQEIYQGSRPRGLCCRPVHSKRAGLTVGVTESLLYAATCYCGCGGTSPSESAACTRQVPDCLFTAKRCTSIGQVTALNQLIIMLSQLRYTQQLGLMDWTDMQCVMPAAPNIGPNRRSEFRSAMPPGAKAAAARGECTCRLYCSWRGSLRANSGLAPSGPWGALLLSIAFY